MLPITLVPQFYVYWYFWLTIIKTYFCSQLSQLIWGRVECLFSNTLCYALGECENASRLRHNTKYLFTMMYNTELTQPQAVKTQAIPYFSEPVTM